MKINAEGLALIKSFEECILSAYQDAVGIWTVGYGHVSSDVAQGLKITQDQADELLAKDVAIAEAAVNKYLKAKVNSNQFSALVSFTFNVGVGNFKQSTLLNCINKNNVQQAAGEFLRWVKAKGIILPGLVRRREAEKLLFEKA